MVSTHLYRRTISLILFLDDQTLDPRLCPRSRSRNVHRSLFTRNRTPMADRRSLDGNRRVKKAQSYDIRRGPGNQGHGGTVNVVVPSMLLVSRLPVPGRLYPIRAFPFKISSPGECVPVRSCSACTRCQGTSSLSGATVDAIKIIIRGTRGE